MRIMTFQGTLAMLLQLQVPLHIKPMLGAKLSPPRQEEPLHEVLVSRVPRRHQEIGVADKQPGRGREERDRLHHVPRELPECEAEEEADLGHEEP